MAVSQNVSHETIDWFVHNESDSPGDEDLAQRWEEWCAEPANRSEYVRMLQLAQDMRRLPPPAKPSRKELLKDFATGEEDSSMSRTG